MRQSHLESTFVAMMSDIGTSNDLTGVLDFCVRLLCRVVLRSHSAAASAVGLARTFFYAGVRVLLVSHWSAIERNTFAVFAVRWSAEQTIASPRRCSFVASFAIILPSPNSLLSGRETF